MQDRLAIWDFVADQNSQAAIRLDQMFSNVASKLGDFPFVGKPGKISGTREWVPNENYRLVYEIADQTVWILTVVHTSREWPPV